MKAKHIVICGVCAVALVLAVASCKQPTDPDPVPVTITYTATQNGGADGTTDSTGIVFTFSASVDSLNLTAADITVDGTAAKGTSALSGTGTTRTLAITVSAAGTATVQITKTGIEAGTKHVQVHKAGQSAPTLTGITATYSGTATIYPTTQLDDLKTNLTVKAQYSNSSETTLSDNDYTLSGTLTVGTSTVTATYGGKTATFTVTVTAAQTPTYTVTFNSNGGSSISPITELNSGNKITEPAPPTKTGYDSKFVGWYDQNLVNAFDFDTPITANITLYAKWDSYQLGDTGPGGGKIFYRSESGFTMTDDGTTAYYLEVAPSDVLTTTYKWSANLFQNLNIPNTSQDIGTGRNNTKLILAEEAGAPAAKACNDYAGGGKTDWFLPSLNELNELYTNRDLVGNFITQNSSLYWSSTQYQSGQAQTKDFANGNSSAYVQSYDNRVRAVRAF